MENSDNQLSPVGCADLLCCPFCGATAELEHSDIEIKAGVNAAAECTNPECRTFGPDAQTAAEAAKKWNTRKDDRWTIEAFKAATNTIMSALVRKWEAEGTRCGEDEAWDADGDEWRERRAVYFECAEELKAALRKFSQHNSPDQPRPKPSAASDCSEILSHELKPESNPMKNIRFHAQRDPFRQNAITLRCGIIDTAKETIAEATSITFTERNLDECVTEDRSSLLTMTENEARGLMDELWIHGIRPSTEFGSVGHLASTERHLDDMRTIAFHKLGIITAKKP
mgnify:FL=1